MRTRNSAGLFDVSHMGEIWVEGEDAIAFVNRLTTNDVTKLVDGQAHYSALTNENGGVVDDLLVYRFDADKLLLVVNAGTTEKDWDWITSHERKDEDLALTNASKDYCQIAVQGPKAIGILQKLTDTNLERDQVLPLHDRPGRRRRVDHFANRIHGRGRLRGLRRCRNLPNSCGTSCSKREIMAKRTAYFPAGLRARNTLRLESAMSLYGHELGDEISPLEANLGWITKLQKGDFIGREALAANRRKKD